MNKLLITIACGIISSSVFAQPHRLAPLPEASHFDTEVSTNVSWSYKSDLLKSYSVRVSFLASLSNNVEVAFGRDDDADGVLSAVEKAMAFGWDAGRWFLQGPDETVVFDATDDNIGERREIVWSATGRKRGPTSWSVSVDGEEWTWGDGAGIPSWVFSRDWTIMKVTVRGVEGAAESIGFSRETDSFLFMIK